MVRLFLIVAVFHLPELVMAAIQPHAGPRDLTDRAIGNQSLVGGGIVQHYLMDPRGEIEGLMLADGSYMYVTSRAAEQLLHAIKPGDRIRVYGLRKDKLIQPDIIRNVSTGTTFIVPLRLDLPLPEQERHLSVTEIQASGTIEALLSHPTGKYLQGLVLSDGTQVRLPTDVSDELRQSLQVGEAVTVRGNGTENQYGKSIEAVAMGRHPSRLVALDASISSLP